MLLQLNADSKSLCQKKKTRNAKNEAINLTSVVFVSKYFGTFGVRKSSKIWNFLFFSGRPGNFYRLFCTKLTLIRLHC